MRGGKSQRQGKPWRNSRWVLAGERREWLEAETMCGSVLWPSGRPPSVPDACWAVGWRGPSLPPAPACLAHRTSPRPSGIPALGFPEHCTPSESWEKRLGEELLSQCSLLTSATELYTVTLCMSNSAWRFRAATTAKILWRDRSFENLVTGAWTVMTRDGDCRITLYSWWLKLQELIVLPRNMMKSKKLRNRLDI